MIRQDLTYKDMYDSIDNIWSLLFMTGYLTQRGAAGQREYTLAIPNKEIRDIFSEQIFRWFQDAARKDETALGAFCDSLKTETRRLRKKDSTNI